MIVTAPQPLHNLRGALHNLRDASRMEYAKSAMLAGTETPPIDCLSTSPVFT